MSWTDQVPEATDVIASFSAPRPASSVEIDKLPDGMYRATAGNLFGSQELTRNTNLEALLRRVHAIIWDERNLR